MDKQGWLDLAEVIDALRIFPRIFMVAYIITFVLTVVWIMLIPTPVTSVHAAILGTIFTVGAGWFGLYVKTGRSWDKRRDPERK